ncbi:MFS transporter [Occultella glacieicola]|uniref:MFS transporter n=1 Tax=Occultella glacieicola TaxID=2518684 RepID=UPI001404FED0|nr:MFS transporter [Occultella glacieicola]
MSVVGTRTGSLWAIKEIRAVFVLCFAGLTSFSITLSALPAWAAQQGHADTVVGTVTGVMLGVTVITQLSSATLMRRYSTRTLLIAGCLLLGLPTPLYLLGTDLWALYAISAVRGVGFAIVTVVGALAIPRAAPVHRRGEAIGIFGLAAAIPMMLGIAGGAALTLGGAFVVVAALGFVPVLALFAARSVSTVPLGGPKDGATSWRRVLLPLLMPAAVLLAVTAAGGGLVTILPLQLPAGSTAGAALLLYGAVGMVARWRIGHLTDRIGHRGLYPLLLAAGVVGLLLAAHGLANDAVGTLMVGAALFGLTYGGMQTVLLDLSYRAVPEEDAPTASAVWNAAFDGGTAAGASVLAFVAGTAWSGDGALLAGAAVVAVVGIMGLVPMLSRREPEPEPEPARTAPQRTDREDTP